MRFRGVTAALAAAMLAVFAGPASAAAPTASMLGVYSTSATDSIAYGEYDDGGQATTTHFAYDTKSSTWCTTNGAVGAPAQTTAEKPEDPEEAGYAVEELHGLTPGAAYCIAFVATNASGTGTSAQVAFTQGVPYADTYAASSTSATTTDVSGSVFGAGQATTYHVDWDLQSSTWCTAKGASGTPAHATATQNLPAPSGDDDGGEVTVTLPGLTAGTAYCAAVSAANGSGTAKSTPVSFVQGQPRVYTSYAWSDSATTASVAGQVDPAGQSTTYRVAYDLASSSWCTGDGTGTPAHTTAAQTLSSTQPGWHDVRVDLTGLTGGTAYCARLTAANGSGSSAPDAFAVPFTPGLPQAWLNHYAPASSTSMKLTGSIDPLGQSTTYRVAYDLLSSDWCSSYGESGSPAHSTTAQSLPTNASGDSVDVSVTISGLTIGTSYCAAFVATNGSGSGTSDVAEFTQGAPTVHGTWVHSTTASTTRVSANVNPSELSTSYHVAWDVESSDWCQSWGTSGTPAHATADASLGFTDVTAHAVSATLTGLTPGTGYCAAIVATNAGGTGSSGAPGFQQGAPTAETQSADPTGASSARVEGSVDPIAQATTYHVAWDLATSDWCQSSGQSGTAAHSTSASTLPFSDDQDHDVAVDIAGLTSGTQYCALLVAVNPSGTTSGWPTSFTAGAPVLTIDDSHATGPTSARATGTVEPGGQATSYHAEYALDSSDFCFDDGQGNGTPDGATPAVTVDPADGAKQNVAIDLSGLTQGQWYCVVLVASNASGETRSWPAYVRTGLPSAVVTDVMPTGGSTATVKGTINAAGQATTYRVAWGLASSDWCDSDGWDGDPAGMAAAQTLGSTDGADHAVTATISGLAARTDHCVAILVDNATGSNRSDMSIFTAGSDAPAVTTGGASGMTDAAATLSGSVAPHGTATSYHFEYGTTTAYGSSTPSSSAGAGDAPVTVSAQIGGLAMATTYHYRLVADNAGGSNAGADMTFTTTGSSAAPSDPPPSDPPHSDPPPPSDPPHSDPPPSTPPASNPPPAGDSPAPSGDQPATGSSGPPTPTDTVGPRVTATLRGLVAKRKLVLRKGVALSVGCDESCAVTVSLVLPAKLARRLGLSPAVGTAKRLIATAGGTARFKVKLSRRARARLAHSRAFRLSIVVAAKDRAGNSSATTKTLVVA